jgi:hypothetical protein
MSVFDILNDFSEAEIADAVEQAERHRLDRDVVHVMLADIVCVYVLSRAQGQRRCWRCSFERCW